MKIFNSLNAKTGTAYLLLALLNISIITGLIFENQSDLIVRNTLLEAEKVVFEVNDEIFNRLKGITLKPGKEGGIILDSILMDMGIKTYAVLNSQAEVLSSGPEFDKAAWSEKDEFVNINRAIFKKENTRKIFHAEIAKTPAGLRAQQHIIFYMPVQADNGESLIVRLAASVQGIGEQMAALYRQCGFLIAGMIVILAVFAFFYDRMVIRPVKLLSRASLRVSEGDYAVQVSVKNRDEIGVLSDSFNGMVRSLDATTASLKDSIAKLEEQNLIIQDELDIAKTIQEGMLPQTLTYGRMSLSVHYRALEKISGDYYDIIEFPDGRCGIFIADVSGHGIPAALITIMAKFILYTYGPQFDSPDALMEKMNHDISRTVKTGDYITAFYMILDTQNKVRFVNAGHHSPILQRKRTGRIEVLKETGTFLGLVEDLPTPYHISETVLEKGDRLILYTDGITEQMDSTGTEYTIDRLKDRIKAHSKDPVGKMVGGIMEDVAVFSHGSERLDDYTLLAIEITADALKQAAEKKKAVFGTRPSGVPAEWEAESYIKNAYTVSANGNGADKPGRTPLEHEDGRLRVVMHGNSISHIEVPLNLLSGIYRNNFPHKNFIKIDSEYISTVPAGARADLEMPKNILLRVIRDMEEIKHIDISSRILSEELTGRENGTRNFIRIKTPG